MVESLNGWTFKLRNGKSNQREEIQYDDLLQSAYDELNPQVNNPTCSDNRSLFTFDTPSAYPQGSQMTLNTSNGDYTVTNESITAIGGFQTPLNILGLDMTFILSTNGTNDYFYYESDTLHIYNISIILA